MNFDIFFFRGGGSGIATCTNLSSGNHTVQFKQKSTVSFSWDVPYTSRSSTDTPNYNKYLCTLTQTSWYESGNINNNNAVTKSCFERTNGKSGPQELNKLDRSEDTRRVQYSNGRHILFTWLEGRSNDQELLVIQMLQSLVAEKTK